MLGPVEQRGAVRGEILHTLLYRAVVMEDSDQSESNNPYRDALAIRRRFASPISNWERKVVNVSNSQVINNESLYNRDTGFKP